MSDESPPTRLWMVVSLTDKVGGQEVVGGILVAARTDTRAIRSVRQLLTDTDEIIYIRAADVTDDARRLLAIVDSEEPAR